MASSGVKIPMTSQGMSNLLLQSTYALNKSHSKRVLIGLDNSNGGILKPVIKFSTNTSKYVTFDEEEWIALVNEMEYIRTYLRDCYQQHETNILHLPKHLIRFTSAYGSRAISLEEKTESLMRQLAVQLGYSEPAPAVTDDNHQRRKCGEKAPPTTVMQLSTFEGLIQVRECIDARLKILKEMTPAVVGILDEITRILHDELNKEDEATRTDVTTNSLAFVRYYTLRKVEIENVVRVEMKSTEFNENTVNLILAEILAFALPTY